MERAHAGAALWFTGLPGSGKSAVARAVHERLQQRGHPGLPDPVYLSMDQRRKEYVPQPDYSDEERERVYAMFVDDARELAGQGRLVLMDATAHRRRWRDRARREIARFAEVWVRCPLEVAMQREESRPEGKVKAGLYKKALERKRTGKQFEGLGPVIGVDEPYEESPRAEVVVDSEGLSVQQARDRVLEYLDNWRTS